MANWIRLNDNFPDHPKAMGLTDKAFRIYITAMCYSGQYLTDGFVPRVAATKFANGDIGIIKELILSGLWIDDVENDVENDGFIIYKFLEFNASNETVSTRKDQLKAAKARYKEKKASELSVKAANSGIIKESIQNHESIRPPTPTPTPTPKVLKDISTIDKPIVSPQFAAFWKIYPRKVGKAAASKAFIKALKKVDATELIEGVNRLAQDPHLDITFCPHASTWLNGERWADEAPPIARALEPKGFAVIRGMLNNQSAIGSHRMGLANDF